MAQQLTPTESQMRGWELWVKSRPQVVQDVISEYGLDPFKVFNLKTTNQRVTVCSVNENGSVTVCVDPKLNPKSLFVGQSVFGINPADLEECDLPEGVAPIPGWEIEMTALNLGEE